MSKHPLTDALCATIWAETKDNWLEYHGPSPTERRVMRTAADWQLEQCVEWLRTLGAYSYASLLGDAMRPTREDN